MKRIIGVDIGASGGKMGIAGFDGERLNIHEYRDFINRPVRTGTAFYWDVFSLYNAILDGMAEFRGKYGEADTIAVDTWGASYALLDGQGRMMEPMYHYRDLRTVNSMEEIEKRLPLRTLFRLTGCQCNRTYTLPQMYTYVTEGNKYILDNAKTMLFLPDLLCYFMGGAKTCELSIAGTSGLMNKNLKDWSKAAMRAFGIPQDIFPQLVDSATYKGKIAQHVMDYTGMENTRIIATVEHDSAAAVAAIPNFGKNRLYISIGTNVSMGVEKDKSVISDTAFRRGFKNTGGIGRSAIVYRDFSACWHLNEFMRTKREKGVVYSNSDLIEIAEKTPSPKVFIDLEYPDFINGIGDFCIKMNNYFKLTGQRTLSEDGEFIRCIFESIALKTHHYARNFIKMGEEFSSVHVVNGATRNKLLMQMISSVLGREISAGMTYATINGNILTQLIAEHEVSSVEQMREISAKSFDMEHYEPQDRELWKELVGIYESAICKDYAE